MFLKFFIGFACLNVATASLHLDKLILKGNDLYNDMNYSYYYDEKQNTHVDFTMRTKVVTTKVTLYMKSYVADNDIRKNRELISTVIDCEKLINGLYGNPLISGFMKNFLKDIQALNLKFPLPAVSFYR